MKCYSNKAGGIIIILLRTHRGSALVGAWRNSPSWVFWRSPPPSVHSERRRQREKFPRNMEPYTTATRQKEKTMMEQIRTEIWAACRGFLCLQQRLGGFYGHSHVNTRNQISLQGTLTYWAVYSDLKPCFTHGTYMNHLFRPDAGQRCFTLNLSQNGAPVFRHTEVEGAAISEPGASQANTGLFALLYILSRVEAAEALQSGSVEGSFHFGCGSSQSPKDGATRGKPLLLF